MSDDVVKSVSGAIVITDVAGRIVQANKAAEALFGYTNTALLSLQIDDLISEQHREQFSVQRKSLASARNKRTFATSEDLISWGRDKDEIPVDVHLTLLNLDGNGYVIAAFRHLAKERELENKLAESDKQVQALNVLSSDWYWRQDGDLRFTHISGWGKETHIANAETSPRFTSS